MSVGACAMMEINRVAVEEMIDIVGASVSDEAGIVLLQ